MRTSSSPVPSVLEVKEEDDPSEASEAGLVGSNVAFESSKHDESN